MCGVEEGKQGHGTLLLLLGEAAWRRLQRRCCIGWRHSLSLPLHEVAAYAAYHMPLHTHMLRCCAGVRVVSSDRHQLLRRVPPAAASCLEIGSTSAGALLYDARRLFDAQDARATGARCAGRGGQQGGQQRGQER